MRSEKLARYREVEFQALRLAVDEGEARFGDVYYIAKRNGPISKKTISKILKNMVFEGLLQRIISKTTRRRAYKATELGTKRYLLDQSFSWMVDYLSRFSQVVGFEIENASTKSLISALEGFGEGITLAFILALVEINKFENEDYKKRAINVMAEAFGEACDKFLSEIGLYFVKKEDLEDRCKEWVKNKFYPGFKELKREMSKIKHGLSSVPEVLVMENMLREFVQKKVQESKLQRARA